MTTDAGSHHRFVVNNDSGLVIRYCVHCGLSHQMEAFQASHNRQSGWRWSLIPEEKGDKTFAEACSAERGSDDLFPYHHFILRTHHKPREWDTVVIRFCVRCGLSYRLSWDSQYTLARVVGMEVPNPQDMHTPIPNWRRIQENERDTSLSDPCPMEGENDALERRYTLIPKL